jgi:hypothetical protein
VVTGDESGQIRRVIVADTMSSVLAQRTQDGERLLLVNCDEEITAQVEQQTGKVPTVPLAAVVDADGNVTGVIAADPVLDAVPNAELVRAYPGVAEGQTFDAGTGEFTQPGFEYLKPGAVDVKTGFPAGVETLEKVAPQVIPQTDAPSLPLMTIKSMREAIQ